MPELTYLLAPLVAVTVSACTSMVGISGAFLLLPFQMSVLGLTGPSASATNLVYNLVATPGGIYRFAQERRVDWRLGWDIAAGSLPGLLAGWWLRSHWLLDPTRFKAFVVLVLLALAVRLLVHQAHGSEAEAEITLKPRRPAIILAALVIGVIGGAYGIGGGAFMAPVLLVLFRRSLHSVAGASLFATFMSSLAGVAMYTLLPAPAGVQTEPDWTLGLLFGVGGFLGTYVGARMQKRLPAKPLGIALAVVIGVLGAGYLGQVLFK